MTNENDAIFYLRSVLPIFPNNKYRENTRPSTIQSFHLCNHHPSNSPVLNKDHCNIVTTTSQRRFCR